MSEEFGWLVAAILGLAVGVAHFAGLIWTHKRARTMRQPAWLLFVSLLVRVGLAIAILGPIIQADTTRGLVALVAFALSRLMLPRLLK
jgi:F1F0 ATPase subunit 2